MEKRNLSRTVKFVMVIMIGLVLGFVVSVISMRFSDFSTTIPETADRVFAHLTGRDRETNPPLDWKILTPEVPVIAADVNTETEAKQSEEDVWMVYDGINFNRAKIEMRINPLCEDRIIKVPSNTIIPYYPGVFEKREFSVGRNTIVAWEHLGFIGFWIHSGWDWWGGASAATQLQYFIENDGSFAVLSSGAMTQRINKCLLGSEVRIIQDDKVSTNKIVAGVRIPPNDVAEISTHTMDLVPFLAANYKNTGFDDLENPGLVLFFCGRSASNETVDASTEYFTQARFIFGLEPIPGVD